MENRFCWTLRHVGYWTVIDQNKQAALWPPTVNNSEWHPLTPTPNDHGWAGTSLYPCKWRGMLGWWHDLLAARYELEHDIRDEPTAEPNVLTVSLADLAHMTSRIATTSWRAPSLEGCCLVLFYPRIWDIQGTPIKKNNHHHGTQEGPGANLHLICVDLYN